MAKGVKTGGRKKGSLNKTTRQLKDMILEALSESGGVKYLKVVARENPAAFCTLLGKVIPLQVTGEGGGPVRYDFRWIDDSVEAQRIDVDFADAASPVQH